MNDMVGSKLSILRDDISHQIYLSRARGLNLYSITVTGSSLSFWLFSSLRRGLFSLRQPEMFFLGQSGKLYRR